MGLKWAVIRLRDRGVRLPRSRWPEPLVGELQLDNMPYTSSNRPLRRAQLLDVQLQWTRSIVQPIFDPHIIGIDGHSTVLQGVEIECCGDDTAEHIQVWHCTPLSDE